MELHYIRSLNCQHSPGVTSLSTYLSVPKINICLRGLTGVNGGEGAEGGGGNDKTELGRPYSLVAWVGGGVTMYILLSTRYIAGFSLFKPLQPTNSSHFTTRTRQQHSGKDDIISPIFHVLIYTLQGLIEVGYI